MRLARILISFGVFLIVASLCRSSKAANICSETVAANRMVDGIPAYSQCTASSSGAIYSNNGVDTSTTTGGTDWVRTQMSGGYQCTELAHRYLYFKWNVQSVPNGNAGTWCDGTIPSGLSKSTTPMHGDLIVFAPGSCGADATTGHVAVIDVVNTNSTVTFVEQNGASRRSCANSTAACFLHATANTRATLDGGTQDSASADSGLGLFQDANARDDAAADHGKADAPNTDGTDGSGGTTGAGGAGGMAGTGGAVGTGGQQATGGALSVGGTRGTGGAIVTITGSGGSAGATSSVGPTASSSNGCSCRLGGGHSTQGRFDGWDALVLVALAVGFITLHRRSSKA